MVQYSHWEIVFSLVQRKKEYSDFFTANYINSYMKKEYALQEAFL
jgi:hypothetical protein